MNQNPKSIVLKKPEPVILNSDWKILRVSVKNDASQQWRYSLPVNWKILPTPASRS